jgi:hypothetical protein
MTDTVSPPRVLTLAEVATRLNMSRSNVAKFLARRDVSPWLKKAQGYFWREEDIERVKAEREADPERMAADERRRQAALRGPAPKPERLPVPRLGPTQKAVLKAMRERPGSSGDGDATRMALMRMRERGLVEAVEGERGLYSLTPLGLEVAGKL